MSKGMTEGKANGRLNMDDLERMAFIGTSATNAVDTDSANTMSAYMTGHKTAVNAIGVYADRTPASLDDPRVETFAEAVRRLTKKSIGIVATAEVEDATPAAVVSHTRNRNDKADVVGMLLDVKPEVLLGGGSAYFLGKEVAGSSARTIRTTSSSSRMPVTSLRPTRTSSQPMHRRKAISSVSSTPAIWT